MWFSGGLHVLLFGGVSVLLAGLILSDPQLVAGESIFAQEAAEVYTSGSWWDQVNYRLDNFLLYRIEPFFIVWRKLSLLPFEAGRKS